MIEEFKSVRGYEGLYEVSNMGIVRSVEREVITSKGIRIYKSKILSPGIQKSGYLYVTLSKEGKSKTFRVHRLVAEAFLPNPDNLSDVDHIDEDKSNNSIENLRWLAHKENSSRSNTGKTKDNNLGKNPRARKVYDSTGNEYSCLKELSNVLNINYSTLKARFRKFNSVEINKVTYSYDKTIFKESI